MTILFKNGTRISASQEELDLIVDNMEKNNFKDWQAVRADGVLNIMFNINEVLAILDEKKRTVKYK